MNSLIDAGLIPERQNTTGPEVQKSAELNGFFLRKISPVDSELWLKMGLLRAKSYVHERKFLTEDVLDENGAEYDDFDEYSDHFVATNNKNEVMGTIRVIKKHDDINLPGEDLFNVNLADGAREISRIIVDSAVSRRLSPLVSVSLMRAALKDTSDRDDNVYAIIEPSMIRYLESYVGIQLSTVADPKYIEEYNSNNALVSMHPRSITSQIHERDNMPRSLLGIPEKLAPFFEQNAAKAGLGWIALRDVHLPNLDQFDRNLGFINSAEHARLQDSVVSIAGAGGDGGELAITLAQLGVGRFRIADPEIFEINNLNRQAGASYQTLGRNKADVIADMIRDINPFADVVTYTDGINQENVDEFVKGSNLVIDETEYTEHTLGVMLARAARASNLSVLMSLNVGFGSYTTSFSPTGKTFESYLGLSETASLQELAGQDVPLSRWVPHIPSYADINIFQKVANQEVSTPTVSPGVKAAALEASTQALAHLLKDMTPQRAKWLYYAPHGKSIDSIDGTKMIRHPRMHFVTSVAVAALRTRMGKNPRAGY